MSRTVNFGMLTHVRDGYFYGLTMLPSQGSLYTI